MYAVIEMMANRHDPEGYGVFVKFHGLFDAEFSTVYDTACGILGTRAKMIHAMGVIGASNANMAYENIQEDGEVQLLVKFRDSLRIWIFHALAKNTE